MDETLPGGSTKEETPGSSKSIVKSILEFGTSLTQTFEPLKQFKTHLCGFAFYNGQPERQVELHHYCAAINQDVIQCAVFDSPDPGARLIGIEYVVSEKIFAGLDEEEQKFWHSHAFDIKSGSFFAPDVAAPAERKLANDLTKTYGKTFVLWQTDRGDTLPLGPPQLMMVANGTDMGWHPELFLARNMRRGPAYNTENILKNREDMIMPEVHPASDHWKNGPALQTKMEKVKKH